MASILALPNEILEFILTSDGIKAVDIAAISQSCQRARKIVFRSATIWRRLYSVHFPDVAHQLENLVDDDPHLFWRSHFISRYVRLKFNFTEFFFSLITEGGPPLTRFFGTWKNSC